MLQSMTSQTVRRDLATEQHKEQIRCSWGLVLRQTFGGRDPVQPIAELQAKVPSCTPYLVTAPHPITCSISACKQEPQKNVLQGPRRSLTGQEGAGRHRSSGAASSPCLKLLPGQIRPPPPPLAVPLKSFWPSGWPLVHHLVVDPRTAPLY